MRGMRGPGGRKRWAALVVVVSIAWASAGCSTWRAARLYQSGTAALEAGNVDRALDDLGEAARLEPGASEIQNHLGLARLAAGDPEGALQSFDRAVQLDCDNEAAKQNRLQVEARLKQRAVDRVSHPRDAAAAGNPAP